MRHLRGFLAVAEELSFTRAADRLHLSQQALSRQVQQMENLLGFPLFNRTTRRVELTDAGRELASSLASPIAEILAAVQRAQQRASRPGPTLRLACAPPLDERVLPSLLGGARGNLAAQRLAVFECWSCEAVRSVAEGRSDAALAFSPILTDRLASTAVDAEPMGVVLPRRPPWSEMAAVTVESLQDLTLVMPNRTLTPGFCEIVDRVFARHCEENRFFELGRYTRELFLGDSRCRSALDLDEAFYVTASLGTLALDRRYLYLPVAPVVPIPIELVYGTPIENETVRELVKRAGRRKVEPAALEVQ